MGVNISYIDIVCTQKIGRDQRKLIVSALLPLQFYIAYKMYIFTSSSFTSSKTGKITNRILQKKNMKNLSVFRIIYCKSVEFKIKHLKNCLN